MADGPVALRGDHHIPPGLADGADDERILAGFDAATFGRAALNGRTISAPNSERMMFFQDAGSALFPWQTVEQNVRCGLKLQKVRGPEQDRRVDYYLGMEVAHNTIYEEERLVWT